MTRTENITLTVFNPETEEYEDIRARVEFTLYVGRVEPFEADEYDWNILWIEGSDWVDEHCKEMGVRIFHRLRIKI